MARSTGSQKAERLNAAHGLLARGLSVAEACVSLSRQFALSRRQAYRYLQEAQALPAPLPVVEPSLAVTFNGFSPSRINATPCHHWSRRQFRISRGWLHADL